MRGNRDNLPQFFTEHDATPPELQTRGSVKDKPKIIFLISPL